jgi:nucleoside-diphosphate-sugar epimerase
MRVVVIGGSGHVGTYLVPRLVEAGHEVINITRGQRAPYRTHGAWSAVRSITLDRAVAEAEGTFGAQVVALQPDVVVDMICFKLESAQHLVQALRGQVQHLLVTCSVWVHGPSVVVPTLETQPRAPFGEYGIQKAAIEAYLLDQAHRAGLPATIIHPGHIVGPGWAPVNPQGNFNQSVFTTLARGETLTLPNWGLETVHHVHADDVAGLFMAALAHWSASVGESFHAVSPAAVTLSGYAQTVAGWFGQEARLEYLPFDQWKATVSPQDADATEDHIRHSPNCSVAKAALALGFRPRYSSFQAVYEALTWLIEHGQVQAPAL